MEVKGWANLMLTVEISDENFTEGKRGCGDTCAMALAITEMLDHLGMSNLTVHVEPDMAFLHNTLGKTVMQAKLPQAAQDFIYAFDDNSHLVFDDNHKLLGKNCRKQDRIVWARPGARFELEFKD